MDANSEKEEVVALDSSGVTSIPPSTAVSSKQLRCYETGYFLSTFSIGPPFASFVTYVGFQLQNIGYVVGHAPGQPPRSGCPATATSCRVPGGLTLIVSGMGDYVNYQREQYIVQLVIYGILCLPIASLRGSDLATFNTLSGLYVAFNVIGFLAGAWMNIFIPFVMHGSEEQASPASQQLPNNGQILARKAIEDGVRMGVWGSNGLSAGQIVLYIISIGLTFVSAVYAGLYTTTAAGALCIVISLVAWRLLPAPRAKTRQEGETIRGWLMLPLTTFSLLFRQVWEYPEAFKYLLAYTIYNDTLFAFGSVTSQLFNLNIRPSLREFTYYSLVQPGSAIISATFFLYLRPTMKNSIGITLRHWTVLCYSITCFCALWCAIGISPSVPIGFKHRWEFYFFQALQSIASSIAGVAFRVLFSRLFPQGNEIKFFGFQLVLSLGTVWVPQIVNGPIVDATNNLRLPAAISSALLLFCVVITLWVDEGKGMRQAGYESTGD
ncbi:hypothetical protein GGR55DRAFT_686078 [Xylaria sp. FL0064]|nr:hypothetical protein GGR55DRAFT_686078 [Xylaria sp. FL0064]